MVGLYPLRVPGKPRFILVFLKMFSFHSYPKKQLSFPLQYVELVDFQEMTDYS